MIEQIALFENGPEDLDCKTTLENIIVAVSAKWKCSNGLFSIQENKSKDKLTGYSIYFEKCLFHSLWELYCHYRWLFRR